MTVSTHDELVLGEIEALFEAQGRETYGEGVTIEAHSLQTAALALAEGADEALIVAALLHDIGHFLELRDDRFGYHKHDRSGGDWLAARFPASVGEPVRLHVAAKRYLCAVDPRYRETLSAASQHSLEKQGGPMTAEQAAEFARNPHRERALRLRRWDDRGKVPGLEVWPLARYRSMIFRLLQASERAP
ncbi:MAG TPA: HD domain-containing protein [Alphaproteobacteria bacterium]|nr:HD domain-containing protein [Alphaproteobacteria bacterium]